jgi:hypothetical protein
MRDAFIKAGLDAGRDPKEVGREAFVEGKTITNTTAAGTGGALGLLAMATVMGGPRAIEAMEAVGQQELVMADVLPLQMGPGFGGKAISQAARAPYEKMGFVFGDLVEGDDLFVHAKLPDGWKKQADPNHSMWSNVVDDKGRKRVAIFYKAAFYDRKAHMTIEPRYNLRNLAWSEDGMTRLKGVVGHVVVDNATGSEMLRSELPVGEDAYPDPNYDACMKWLEAITPRYTDPSHWDGV